MKTIDPKIFVDSSDDEDSDEDDDDQDAPLGPALPPPSQPSQPSNRSTTVPRAQSPLNLSHLPLKNETTLGDAHNSHVSTISLEPSGTRLVTASLDGTAKLWDFHTMDRSLKPFRTFSPLHSDNDIRVTSFSRTGAHTLFAGGDASAVIADRDGTPIAKTAKGDMYLVDASRTKGHTAGLNVALWGNGNTIVTGGEDATVRVWDLEKQSKDMMGSGRGRGVPLIEQISVAKIKTNRGGKAVVLAADWMTMNGHCEHGNDSTVALACSDNMLRLFDVSSPMKRPHACVSFDETHASSVACANGMIAIRTSDSVQLFDNRKLTKPIHKFSNLPNTVSETDVAFMTDDYSFILTGTSATREQANKVGLVYMFSVKRMQEVWKGIAPDESGSVISVLWHSGINQVIYGCANGRVHVMYDEDAGSERGVSSCLEKSNVKKRHGVSSIGVGPILTGSEVFHAMRRGRLHSAISEGDSRSVIGPAPTLKKARRDAADASNPKEPRKQPKGSSKQLLRDDEGNDIEATSMAKYIDSQNLSKDWSQDPRQALLKYAEEAERNPIFTKGYETTQPDRLLAEKTAEQEEEESRRAIYGRDLLAKQKLNKQS